MMLCRRPPTVSGAVARWKLLILRVDDDGDEGDQGSAML